VTSFQQSKGLPATGNIDTATWIELLKLPAATSRRSPKTATIGPRKREFPATAGLR
jgi:peptidoglycan hydrolase-like protein with peptidoglycan-binding domain